jgi:hypothetical protein
MKCPSCNHEFKLKVRQYLREPRGRHNCPACGVRFKLKHSFSYIALVITAEAILAAVPAFVVLHFTQHFLYYVITLIICSVIFVVPLDFLLDDRWRKSAKI